MPVSLQAGDTLELRMRVRFSSVTATQRPNVTFTEFALTFTGTTGVIQKLTLKQDGTADFTNENGITAQLLKSDGYLRNTPIGINWNTLWSNSSGNWAVNSIQALDSGERFSEWSWLEFEYKSDSTDQYRIYAYKTPSDFTASGITIPTINEHMGITRYSDTQFQILQRYGQGKIYAIRGHK